MIQNIIVGVIRFSFKQCAYLLFLNNIVNVRLLHSLFLGAASPAISFGA